MLSNYPPGVSDHTSGAPWNDDYEPPEKDFEVECSQTLCKTVNIITRNYAHYEDESEDGVDIWDDTSDTEWEKEFKDNGYYTPLELIGLFKEFLEEQLKQGIVFKSPAYTQHLIKECRDWEEDEITFYEDK